MNKLATFCQATTVPRCRRNASDRESTARCRLTNGSWCRRCNQRMPTGGPSVWTGKARRGTWKIKKIVQPPFLSSHLLSMNPSALFVTKCSERRRFWNACACCWRSSLLISAYSTWKEDYNLRVNLWVDDSFAKLLNHALTWICRWIEADKQMSGEKYRTQC